MLEINRWFFVLLLNFIVLLFVLNIIFFRPLLKLFAERENSINGSLDAARDMEAKKEEALLIMNRELVSARKKATDLYEKILREGLAIQKDMLDAANMEARQMIDNAARELKTDAERVRQALRSEVGRFSDEIVRKLIGI